MVSGELEKWPEHYTLENYPGKADILQALSSVHAYTEQYLATLNEAQLTSVIKTSWGDDLTLYWIIWHVIEHEIHHRGELSLILGMMGKEAPDV